MKIIIILSLHVHLNEGL